jgi:alpha-glucoside transport system substrate-binding protein
MRKTPLHRGKLWLGVVMVVIVALLGSFACATTPTATPTPTSTVPATPTPTVAPTATPAVSPIGSVEVLGEWSGEELDSFNAMVAPWQQQTGGKVDFTGTRDFIAVLTTRVQSGNPPDVAILPNPGLMQQLANSGKLIPLSNFLDMTTINADYSKGWVDLGTVNGKFYAFFMKAASKGTVWYNPKTFAANNWTTPQTWDEMIALSDQIVADKLTPKYPWSIAVESGAASGWPAADWIDQIFLSKYGPDVSDQWVNHEIPWTDPRVKDAFQMFGQIALTPGYVPGGATAILATYFQNGSYLPYEIPPLAAMDYLGDFAAGFISTQFPDLVAGEDYNFFDFPTITPAYANAVTGGANLVVVFKDTPAVRSFVQYLSTAAAQDIWVKRGGFTSVNNKVSLSDYPNIVTRNAAEQLSTAAIFRFSQDDAMPSAVENAFWSGILSYLQNPNQLDSILANIESVAEANY